MILFIISSTLFGRINAFNAGPANNLLFSATIGSIFGVLAVLFLIVDIGSDVLLANECREASVSVSGHGCQCREVEISPRDYTAYKPFNLTEFPRQVLCTMYGPEDINLDHSFMWMTISALSLGGIGQTVMATYHVRQENTFFSRLPKLLKVVMLVLSPIMMGPVAIVVHFIMRCAKGISLDEMMKYKVLIGTFKVVDIIFKSLFIALSSRNNFEYGPLFPFFAKNG